MISINDYKNDEGRVDWPAYDVAQIACGEKCQTCGELILNINLWGGKSERLPGPQDCYSCRVLIGNSESVRHDRFIRCPECGAKHDPRTEEEYRVMEEGEHSYSCDECDCEFNVSTSVVYTYTSPNMKVKNE